MESASAGPVERVLTGAQLERLRSAKIAIVEDQRDLAEKIVAAIRAQTELSESTVDVIDPAEFPPVAAESEEDILASQAWQNRREALSLPAEAATLNFGQTVILERALAEFRRQRSIPPALRERLATYDLVLLDNTLAKGEEEHYRGEDIAATLNGGPRIISASSERVSYGEGTFPFKNNLGDPRGGGRAAERLTNLVIETLLRE